MFDSLGIKARRAIASQLNVSGKADDLVINICEAVGADVYLSGQGARAYQDEKKFQDHGIELRYQEYSNQPYPQCHPGIGFVPELSALDLILTPAPRHGISCLRAEENSIQVFPHRPTSLLKDTSKLEKAKRIFFLTGARSEYDLISPVLRAVCATPALSAEVIVGAAHLSPFHGMGVERIRRDGFPIAGAVESLLASESWSGRGLSFCNLVEGVTRLIAGNRPDLMFVAGDREEALAGALAAVFQKIPVAHLFGGDRVITSELDELLRPSISKLAHLHFTATESHRQRLIRMGEEAERVWAVGGTGLDRLREEPDLPDDALNNEFMIDVRKPFFLLIHHPSPLINPEESGREMAQILEGILSLGLPVLCSYPNFDPGNIAIRRAIDDKKAKHNQLKVFHSLPSAQFAALYRRCSAIVGNSSSIVIESGFLKPGVLVGPRQDGREIGSNIICTGSSTEEVREACLRCLEDEKFKEQVRQCPSIYGDGFASPRIARILAEVEIGAKLFLKEMTY